MEKQIGIVVGTTGVDTSFTERIGQEENTSMINIERSSMMTAVGEVIVVDTMIGGSAAEVENLSKIWGIVVGDATKLYCQRIIVDPATTESELTMMALQSAVVRSPTFLGRKT
jgi:hypothetical protein